jgi:hypothetical protein
MRDARLEPSPFWQAIGAAVGYGRREMGAEPPKRPAQTLRASSMCRETPQGICGCSGPPLAALRCVGWRVLGVRQHRLGSNPYMGAISGDQSTRAWVDVALRGAYSCPHRNPSNDSGASGLACVWTEALVMMRRRLAGLVQCVALDPGHSSTLVEPVSTALVAVGPGEGTGRFRPVVWSPLGLQMANPRRAKAETRWVVIFDSYKTSDPEVEATLRPRNFSPKVLGESICR